MLFYICVGVHHHNGFEVVFDAAENHFNVVEPLKERNLAVFNVWVLHCVVRFEGVEEWVASSTAYSATSLACSITSS